LLKTEIISMKNVPFLLIFLFVIQGVIYSGMYPLWDGWDEPWHFAYVQHIVEKKELPTEGDKVSNEVVFTLDKLPLANLDFFPIEPGGKIHHDFWNDFDAQEVLENKNKLSEIPYSERINPSNWNLAETKQPPLAYLTQAPVYLLFYDQDILERSFTLRIFSVLVTVLAIVFAYKTISLIFNDHFIRIGSLMYIVFTPMFTTNISRVNNEFLTILLFSIFLYLLVLYLKGKTNTLHVVLIGLVLGFGLLTKHTFLIAVGLVPIVIFLKHIQNSTIKPRISKLHSLKNLGLIFGITIPMVSWWYYDRIASGNFTGIKELQSLTIGEYFQGFMEIRWDIFAEFFFKTFWGTYGWSFYIPESPYFEAIIIFVGICIAGLGYGIVKRIKKRDSKILREWRYQSIFILGLSIVLLIIGQLIISVQAYYSLDYGAGLFLGWYLFITITAISMLILLGFRTLIINSKLKKFQNESLLVAFIILIIFNTTTFYWLLPNYYVGV